MAISVAVVDPYAALRRGLVASFASAGFTTSEPGDLDAWAHEGTDQALVLSVVDSGDLERLENLRRDGVNMPIVTLLPDPDPEAYRAAIRAGASTGVDRAADPERIVECVRLALSGQSALPIEVVRTLAVTGARNHAGTVLYPEEVGWLQTLARGATVARLACEVGYSEREMFRILSNLYQRMGVVSRTEALVQAAQSGLLESS